MDGKKKIILVCAQTGGEALRETRLIIGEYLKILRPVLEDQAFIYISTNHGPDNDLSIR